MDPLTETAAGVAAGELLAAVKDFVGKIFCSKSCQRLQNTLEAMIPVLQGTLDIGVELSEHRQKQLTDFCEELQKGKELVQNYSEVGRFRVFERYAYENKIEELEKYIAHFNNTQGLLHVMSDLHRLIDNVANIERGIEATREEFEILRKVINDKEILVNNQRKRRKIIDDNKGLLKICKKVSDLSVPESPDCQVGLGILVNDLKEHLLCEDVRVLGVKGMVGSGKTTLAITFCNDPQVKDHYKKRIFFVKVSQSPNLKALLERMYDNIVGGHRPESFQDAEDAHTQLQKSLHQMKPQPTLVVLDDVWKSNDLDILLFKGEGYQTLVTTRNNIYDQSNYYQYQMPLLSEPDAVSLFCFWAFKDPSIPETADFKLVNEVIEECKGLPLPIKLIGRSLHGQPHAAWMTAKEKLSQGQTISDYHETTLLKCMSKSIDMLKEDVRECFLDMGLFPEGRKIPAYALLDLGVYVHKLKWTTTCTILTELASRSLVNLVNNQIGTLGLGNSYGSSDELSFTQHDVMRDWAIYLTEQDPTYKRKRFIMPEKAEAEFIRKTWKKHVNCTFNAEIVSFHTGSMEEKDWCQMNFPNAKALILNFSASEYFLPPFLQSMPKLKVLIIVNRSSQCATLKGVSVLSSLTRLKVVRLKRVTVPPLQHCLSWQKLERLSLVLCEGYENMTTSTMGLYLNTRRLLEFTIDHCSYLEELHLNSCSLHELTTDHLNAGDLSQLPLPYVELPNGNNSPQIIADLSCA